MKNIKPLNTPNFSLILIFGNDAPFIKGCLNSLIEQKFAGLEIICLNLDSSDETAQIISSFEKKYSYIKLADKTQISNINQAYNQGLKLAQGKYVKFINARSVFYKFALELLFRMLEQEQTTAVLHTQSDLAAKDEFMVDTSWKWLKETTSPALTENIVENCLNIPDIANTLAFDRLFALENKIVFDETLSFSDTAQFINLLFLSQKISLVYMDIVKQLHPLDFLTVTAKILTSIRKNFRVLTNIFEKQALLKIWRTALNQYLISQLAHAYKFVVSEQKQKFADEAKNILNELNLATGDISSLNGMAKFDYCSFMTNCNTPKVSVILIGNGSQMALKSALAKFLNLKSRFAEVILFQPEQSKTDDYIENISHCSSFIRVFQTDECLSTISDKANGEYLLLQDINNIYMDNLWDIYSYAANQQNDMLLGVIDNGLAKNISYQGICKNYLKYSEDKFSAQNIYANLILDILYHDTQILYKKAYIKHLQEMKQSLANPLLLPLLALFNTNSISLYNKLIKAYKKDVLNQSQINTLENLMCHFTSEINADFQRQLALDEILYRFRVASIESFSTKLGYLQQLNYYKLHQFKITKDEATQNILDYVEVKNSPLWDERYYLSQFDYSAYANNVSPLEHYLLEGWKKGFSPSKFFNGPLYAKQHNLTEQNPLVFFLQNGRFRYKAFPENTYLASDEKIKDYWLHKKKNRKVIYMCITGDYDNLEEIKGHYYINPEWDYVCFTDNQEYLKQKTVGIWQIKKLQYTKLDNTRNNRWHKVNPHLLFKNYDESIYLDSNINILSPYLFEEIKERDEDLLLPKHAGNFSIYHEFNWALKKQVDKPELIMEACEEIMNNGFPFFYGMPECNIIYRRHNSLKVKEIMTEWWYWIEHYAKRDQLSFSYLLWKHHITVKQCTFVNARIDYQDFCVFVHPIERCKL